MEKEKNKNKNKLINISLVILSIATIITSVTYAWFVFTKQNEVDKITLEVDNAIDVSIVYPTQEEIFKNTITIPKNSQISEYLSDGVNFYSPIANSTGVQSYYKDENYKENIIELKTKVRTDKPIYLYFNPESIIFPNNDNVLEDNIAGALRVAFVHDDPTNPTAWIWAPNSQYQYIDDSSTIKNGAVEPNYYLPAPTKDLFTEQEKIAVDTKNSITGYDKANKFFWGNWDNKEYFNVAEPVLTIDFDTKGYKEVPFTIRIWIEGTDREAMPSLIGGQFHVNLYFQAVAINKGKGSV